MTTDFCEARFLVTFDDGPHGNTVSILKQLAHNPVQQGIKAMFFVQTRNTDGGRSRLGRSLLKREHEEGHVLGLHTGTAGHVSHTSLSQTELESSLRIGMDDIRLITHDRAMFVRPPYWRFNSDTQAGYHRQGLHMMLSDAKAYDGVDWGQHIFRRWNFRSQLNAICRRIQRRDIPSVDGVVPIVVTFHDTNTYTADHLNEYLDLLIEESNQVGLPLNKKPFYDYAPEIMRAAFRRAVGGKETARAEAWCGEVSSPCPHK
ncbi:MAG: polysaccharide deacetylase family protein [Nitrospirota bacterium]